MSISNRSMSYIVLIMSIILTGLISACSNAYNEKVSLTPQSLISLNSMSKEDAVHKLKKEGWQRTGLKYNNITYYRYWNPSITPDETYIVMDKPGNDEVFSYYSESEDVFNQWNDSLKKMEYKKVGAETKFGNTYSTWEKDTGTFVFEMSSIPTFTDETATTINGMIYELKTRKSDKVKE